MSGHEVLGFQAQWVTSSGASPKAGVVIEHGLGLMLLHYLACVDRLNVRNLAAVELLCRRLLQIQRAVRKNPRQPDFEGLEGYVAHALDPSGGVLAFAFDRFYAGTQKDTTFILKQNRLAREEQVSESNRKAKAKAKGGKGGKDAADGE